jgi:hypothetical protein
MFPYFCFLRALDISKTSTKHLLTISIFNNLSLLLSSKNQNRDCLQRPNERSEHVTNIQIIDLMVFINHS